MSKAAAAFVSLLLLLLVVGSNAITFWLMRRTIGPNEDLIFGTITRLDTEVYVLEKRLESLEQLNTQLVVPTPVP